MSNVMKLINQRIIHSFNLKGLGLTNQSVSIFVMWLFTVSALIGISLGYSEWFIPKTPLNLLIGLVLLLVNVPLVTNRSKFLFVIAFAVGMFMEILGTSTGKIFGIYEYGSNLGLKVWGVPLMIGVYWAVLVIVTSHIAKSIFKSIFSVSVFSALLMVGLDFLMEQMASVFDFWHFENGLAGILNYISWFIISLFLQVLAFYLLPKYKGAFCKHLYFNQIAFFSISYLLYLFI